MPVTLNRFTGPVDLTRWLRPNFLSSLELHPPTHTGLLVLSYTRFTVAIDPERCLTPSTTVDIGRSQLREVERGDDWRAWTHSYRRRSSPTRHRPPATI
ncbi:hypothetical protein QMK17_22795 [Rhodococcus sp. G-MC3]|uniref:hypothetical protein n=1 Tax=Rhodococcus sp. G-MC3 TaxID=3046209 RepID=UPI0024BA3177|nr:hypothetical protein [Rhodococcus sp. G-MC3]MDJ0396151.1 hypothetical protein [Rhodococcus sp. G-MC3]